MWNTHELILFVQSLLHLEKSSRFNSVNTLPTFTAYQEGLYLMHIAYGGIVIFNMHPYWKIRYNRVDKRKYEHIFIF